MTPTPNFRKQLKELLKLKLPKSQFAVFGSGPLAIRGIRDSKDLDITVKSALWKKLVKRYKINANKKNLIKIGNLEIGRGWRSWFSNANALIDDADIICGLRFVKLKYWLKWKKAMSRQKDKKDLKLFEKIMKKQKTNFTTSV